MMDLSDGKGSGSGTDCTEADLESKRSCADCGTAETPLWRAGPSGPKSLCNACGIRYRKRRRDAVGSRDGVSKVVKRREDWDVLMKMGVVLKQKEKRLGEVEEAAVLLMAMSSGLLCNSR